MARSEQDDASRLFHDVYKLVSTPSPWREFYRSDNDKLDISVSQEIKDRDKNYSKLLQSYVTTTRVRNFLKEIHKWLLFWGMVFACVKGYQLIERILTPILASNDVSVLVAAIPVLVTSLVAFISAIIAVPLAVVKFLFNAKEDDNITDIIKHTQEHDAKGRIWVKPNRDKAKQTQDSPSKESHTNDSST